MEISRVGTPGVSTLGTGAASRRSPVEGLGKTFEEALEGLTQSEARTNDLVARLAAGEDVDLHRVVIALEETGVNFRVAMAIRDRLIEAYREVMRMAV